MLLLVCLLPLLIIHRANYLFWELAASPNTRIWYEFRGIVFYLFDVPLLLLILTSIVLLLLSADWRKQWLNLCRSVVLHHGGVWWLLLLLWMLISLAWADDPIIGFYHALRSLSGFYLALWIAVLVYCGAAVTLLRSIVIAGVIHATIAMLQVLKGAPLGWTWLGEYQPSPANPWGFGFQDFQAYGLAIHPNNLAGYLLISLFAVLVLMRHNWLRTGWMANLEHAALVIIGGGLLATASRTAILAGTVGIILSLILAPPRLFAQRRLRSAMLLLLLIATITFALITPVINRLTMLIGENFTTRFTFAFADTMVVIRENPVLGVGHGNLMLRIAELRAGSPDLLLPAHNVLYIIRAELGLVGVFLFAAGIVTILLRLRRNNPGGVALWGCCIAALSIVMLLDFYLWAEVRSHLLLWLVLGLWWGYNLLHSVGDSE
jgi:hypothetical protein